MQDKFTGEGWQLQLVSLFCWVDDGFALRGWADLTRRFSPNSSPRCADSELLTAYLFARLRGLHKMKQAVDFSRDFLISFFPNLPKYSAFVERLHRLTPAIAQALHELPRHLCWETHNTVLIDSLPVVLAKGRRALGAKVARDMAGTGHCAVKSLWYHGLKIHLVAQENPGSLPRPCRLTISPGNIGDIKGLQDMMGGFRCVEIYGDKAYACQTTEALLKEQGCALHTPRKKFKGHFHHKGGDAASRTVSRRRQPIESLFAWIHEKTDIQNASRIRSSKGLLFFVMSSLLVAFILFPVQ